MATNSENILQRASKEGLDKPSAGLKVPEGYFDNFNTRMAAMLPERPEIETVETDQQIPTTLWTKIRPYVYMAAMFAGVWCMLQMFTAISGAGKLQPISENAILAEALSSDEFMMDYIYDDVNSWDIVDEMMEDGIIDKDTQFTDFVDMNFDESDADYILPQ